MAGESVGIQIVSENRGPGLGHLGKVLDVAEAEGRTTNVGLAGTKRLVGDVEMESYDGLGTTVKVRRWCPSQG